MTMIAVMNLVPLDCLFRVHPALRLNHHRVTVTVMTGLRDAATILQQDIPGSNIVGRAQKRFKPFEQPHGSLPNTLELRFSRRCLESGETDMSLMDIQESTYQGKDILTHCLKLMPKKIVGQALVAKEADCEYKHLSALAMAWVAEARAQDKQLREMLVEDKLARYAVSAAEASILRRIEGAASCLSEAEEELHADSASHLEHDSSSDFDIND
ncbi:hypothetical protein EV424DRAFT_1344033 [Suillus variegatus]|nr:hypothetical protein EV424DRAFT_1344033 [Suillus variegatus]